MIDILKRYCSLLGHPNCFCQNTLVQWNIMMYANVTFPLTLVSNNFSPCSFNGIKIGTAFKYIFEEMCQNCQWILEIVTHKTLTRTNNPALSWILVLRNHNTVTSWSYLLLKYHILTIVTHPEDTVLPAWSSDSCGFCLEPATTCRYHNMITWHHHCTSVLGGDNS